MCMVETWFLCKKISRFESLYFWNGLSVQETSCQLCDFFEVISRFVPPIVNLSLTFLTRFLLRSRHVQLFNLLWSHWHRSCSHHWTLFLQHLRLVDPTTKKTYTKNEKHKLTTKKRHRKKHTQKRRRNIWTSLSLGMDFFKVGLKTPMWLCCAEKTATNFFPRKSEERAGISYKPPGSSGGEFVTRRLTLLKERRCTFIQNR